MAKSTTTTKAKIKTTKKKPAASSVSKTAKATTAKTKKPATKANSKTTAKKTTATKTVKTTRSTVKVAAKTTSPVVKNANGVTPLLNRVQVLLGGLFAALAVFAGFFMTNDSVQVLLGHLTKDELASRSGTVLAPAAHVLYEVEFRWMVVGMLSIVAVIAILRGTRYYAQETVAVRNKVAPLRWIDYAITSAVIFEIAALLNGLQDAVALKLGVISILVAAYLGWVFERENAATGKPAKATYVASTVLAVVPVILLAATMYATWMYGMVRSPWYAYAAAAISAVSILYFVRAQRKIVSNSAAGRDYYSVDRNYNRLATLAKLSFALVLIAGLYSSQV